MKTHCKPSDPIIDEIHRVRRKIVNDACGNLRALGEFLMKSQERHGKRLVTLPPKRIKTSK